MPRSARSSPSSHSRLSHLLLQCLLTPVVTSSSSASQAPPHGSGHHQRLLGCSLSQGHGGPTPFADREQEQLSGRPGVLLSQRMDSSARRHDPVLPSPSATTEGLRGGRQQAARTVPTKLRRSRPRLRAIRGHDRHPCSVTGKGGFDLGLQVPGPDLFLLLFGVSCSYCFSLNPNMI
jgi:hypothetical protein